jgi:hypothetical protein
MVDRYCRHAGLGNWKKALGNCDKGTIMMFLFWICETYLARKKGKQAKKKKSLNIYWRDFKMLYRRVNGVAINTNISNEVIKVCYLDLSYPTLYV